MARCPQCRRMSPVDGYYGMPDPPCPCKVRPGYVHPVVARLQVMDLQNQRWWDSVAADDTDTKVVP
jgi:hypothetical protein